MVCFLPIAVDGPFSVGRYVCRAAALTPPKEEESVRRQIVFVLAGTFLKASSRGKDVGQPNQVLFFEPGESYEVTHPDGAGDDSLVLEIPEADWADWVRIHHQSNFAVRPPSLPPRSTLSSPKSFMNAWRIAKSAGRPVDCGSIRQAAYALLDSIGSIPVATSRGRDLSEDAKVALARWLTDPRPLARIARELGVSYYHLCHRFRAETGIAPHAYLRRLRVREAVRRLDEGVQGDLTALALDLGFYDHSHFTRAFRSEFDLPPSAWRRCVESPGQRRSTSL